MLFFRGNFYNSLEVRGELKTVLCLHILGEVVGLPWQCHFKWTFFLLFFFILFRSSLHSDLARPQHHHIMGKWFGCDTGSFWLQKSSSQWLEGKKKKELFIETIKRDIKAKTDFHCNRTEDQASSVLIVIHCLFLGPMIEFFHNRQRTLWNCKWVWLQALCGNIFSPYSPYIISA